MGDSEVPDPDFFVSYTGVDRAWAEWIAWSLEAAEYRVVIQAWDFGAGSHVVEEMHRATAHAARIVAVLSAAYLESAYAAPGWQAAWAADPRGRARKLLVFRIEECLLPGLFAQIVSVDLFGVGRDVARRAVLAAAAGERGKPAMEPGFPGDRAGAGGVSGPAFPPDLPAMGGVPARLAHFVGRESLLAQVHERLAASGSVAVTALAGMGGVGKTALVVEYIHRYAAAFDRVGWVPAERPELIDGFLAHVAPVVGLSADAKPTAVVAAWARLPRSLLVFDNADDPDAIRMIQGFRPSPGAGRLLVTSRRRGLTALGATITVPLLARAEAMAMLTGRFPGLEPTVADRICALLGDLPLAVEQAAGYLDQTGTPPGEYADLLADQLGDMLGEGEVADRQGMTVAVLWELSLQRLRGDHPAAVELLELCALCDPETIPLDLFADPAGFTDGPLKDAVGNRVRWAATVGALVGYSLARRDRDAVDVHRLVQAVTRRAMSGAVYTARIGTLVRLLHGILPENIEHNPEAWPAWRVCLPHVTAVLGHTDADATLDGLSWLCDRTATYLREHGQPAAALPLYQRALTIHEAAYGSDHPAVARDLHNQAVALAILGRAGEALPLYQRALTIHEAAYGSDHPAVARDLVNQAEALRTLGRAGEALPLYQRALTIDEVVYGSDHPDVAATLNNQALALYTLGRAGEALPLYQRALTIHEAAYGPDHPDVATGLNNQAVTLVTLGRAGEALPRGQRALTIHEVVYGPDHPAVARDLVNQAAALDTLGRTAEALPLYQRALTIDEAAYGPDHPTVATDLTSQAVALDALGRTGDALPLLRRALAIHEAAYGPDHPDVATDLTSQAAALDTLGRTAEALPLYQRALTIHEAAYGPDHPDVATTLNNQALALYTLGRARDALPLLRRALAIHEAAYGPDHPAVARDLNNQAAALVTLGRAGEALPLGQRALTIHEAAYGPDHPAVARDLVNQALALRTLGRAGEALPLYQRALTIHEAAYGPDHPDVATTLNNQALALRTLGRAGEALPLYQRALTINETAYGPDHPDVAIDLNNQAVALDTLGRTGEALPLYQRALAIHEAVYGPDHPRTITVRKNLTAARKSTKGRGFIGKRPGR
ncbi:MULTISPECIES: FxSxx-COOH system tetratricopeptide repeat protein [unclassified Frankia]|uniref:FxSxx-COOH system tetratricopeptide repeat protein n=1 Tax=unclassified Frankia TaxID=2632575 RepID=UPI001EF6082C|nr:MULTISPECIES: FxSxx-COOH system tetratricopeptide repeat protein [unclassified Frankia]